MNGSEKKKWIYFVTIERPNRRGLVIKQPKSKKRNRTQKRICGSMNSILILN